MYLCIYLSIYLSIYQDVDTESGQVQGFSEEDTKILLEKVKNLK